MIEVAQNTPLQTYILRDQPVLVKREDLCAPKGAPPFSKIRGIVRHLQQLKAQGVEVVGYTETAISMAGWGLAWAGRQLNLKVVIFEPQYKQTPELLIKHKKQWVKHGAELIPIKAGMAKVNWAQSKKILKQEFGSQAVLLPLGMPFEETVQATAEEMKRTLKNLLIPNPLTVVINVGSGTIAAGVWRGMAETPQTGEIYGIMGRTGNKRNKMKWIEKKAGVAANGFFKTHIGFNLIDPEWQYTQRSAVDCPFPCHPYYDLKAWQWLTENIENLKHPVLFWNIGC